MEYNFVAKIVHTQHSEKTQPQNVLTMCFLQRRTDERYKNQSQNLQGGVEVHGARRAVGDEICNRKKERVRENKG